MIYIGCDPGAHGAMAFIWEDGVVAVRDFDDLSALSYLRQIYFNDLFAVVEAVHSMPRDGRASAFKFGRSTGTMIGWLEALGVPYVEVTPAKWRREVMDSAAKAKGGDTKADSLTLARKLFPGAAGYLERKKDHNRAEALLIAEYARRVHNNGE